MLCKADVIVVDRQLNKTIDVMADMPSLFGPQLSLVGLKVSKLFIYHGKFLELVVALRTSFLVLDLQ